MSPYETWVESLAALAPRYRRARLLAELSETTLPMVIDAHREAIENYAAELFLRDVNAAILAREGQHSEFARDLKAGFLSEVR